MTREEAIRILASSCIPGSKQTEALETLIPELAESEDERTRKALVDLVSTVGEYYLPKLEARNKMLAYLEKQKEQKSAESISQLTVQGKGVYKICPRCKERMVRDDSMVYTSMPPQYRYECPKCGESECDTVMYDNPEMEEQKPEEWNQDEFTENIRRLITDKLTITTKGSDGSTLSSTVFIDDKTAKNIANGILFYVGKEAQKNPDREIPEWSEEDEHRRTDAIYFLETAKTHYADTSELDVTIAWLKSLKPQYHGDVTMTEAYKMGKEAGVAEMAKSMPKPAEWSEEDEAIRIEVIKLLSNPSLYEACEHLREESVDWLKTLHTKVNVNSEKVSANSEKVNVNWSEEDEKMLKCCLIAINHYEKTCNIGDHLPTKFNIEGYLTSVDKVKSWLKSLRPSWKPSEDELAKRHLDGYCMGREDTMREMKDFIESHFNTQSGTSTLKAEG